jgi:hypothetical protein
VLAAVAVLATATAGLATASGPTGVARGAARAPKPAGPQMTC